MKILISILLIFHTGEIFSQANSVEAYQFPERGIEIDKTIDFLTTGERFYKLEGSESSYETWKEGSSYDGQYYYRVSFVVSEIYYNLLTEKVRLPWTEDETKKVEERNFFRGFDIAKGILEYERLTNLKFKEWKDFQSFTMAEGSMEFEVKIESISKIKVVLK